eukprot:UN23796
MSVASVEWLLRRTGVEATMVKNMTYGDTVLVYENSPGIDWAFGLHAFCGLLWLVVSYVQMVHVPRLRILSHRKFGYFAMLTFCCHVCAGLNALWFDEAKHHPIIKIMLLSPMIGSARHMVSSIMYAKRRDIKRHTDSAVMGFLLSIEGAGTIRTVAYIQGMFAAYLPDFLNGASPCQARYGGRATQCVPSYAAR